MARILPIHRSLPPGGILPRGMTKTALPADQFEFIERFALSIFADCVNAGRTFQDAVTACYLSGLQNGLALQHKVTPAAGVPAAQQPLDDAANNAGVATGSRNASPSESVTRGSLPPDSTKEPSDEH